MLVYGKQVSDFRTVNYDHIFTTSIGAVQELARKVEAQEAECTELREANVALRDRLTAMETQLIKVVQTVSVLQQAMPGKDSVPIAQK